MTEHDTILIEQLRRIADALEGRTATVRQPQAEADAYVFSAETLRFRPVDHVNALPLALLKGLEEQKIALLANTERFMRGLPANNALLWGARGTGKSSLVKAIHHHLSEDRPGALTLIEVAREDIGKLPEILLALRTAPGRFLLLCDDLSFDAGDTTYKSLKSVLDGGLEGRPENVLFYATSNRRHLMPRDMAENEARASLQPGEAIEEKVSLSDRFGLWLGFHHLDQETYLTIVLSYCEHFGLKYSEAEALEWATTRGARSGRVAWQFIANVAGRDGKTLNGND